LRVCRVVFLAYTNVFVFRVFPSDKSKLISWFKVSENKSRIFVYNIKKWENKYFIFNVNKYVRLTCRASVAPNEKGSCGIRLSGI